MARKKKISPLRIAGLVAIALLIALGVWAWQRRTPIRPTAATTSTELALPPQIAAAVSATSGVSVQLSGKLQISEPPRDEQLGVSAGDAAVLLRSVAMYQWQEHCDSGGCRYDTEWSAQPVDSNRFRAPDGHKNPRAPFVDARFVAGDVRLGELSVDSELVAAQHPPIDYPVKANALPPNLAATFSVVDGVLYAGGDAAHPKIGTLRISYRIVPGGEVSVSGVRRGLKLEAR